MIIRKILKILGFVLLGIILLNVILVLLFTLPGVQKAAADFAIEKLKPKLKTEISIDKVRIKFFNRVELGGIYVEDQKKDTLLYAESLTVGVNFLDALHNQLDFRTIELNNFVANVNATDTVSPYNFQFIIDAFSSKNPTPKDTTKAPFKVVFRDVKLKNGSLSYHIFSKPQTPGHFNANHLVVKRLNLHASATSIDPDNLIADIHKLSLWEHAGIAIASLEGMVRSKGSRLWSDKLLLSFNQSDLKVARAVYDTRTQAFSVRAQSKQIHPKDVSLFVSRFSHLTQPFLFEIDAEGKLPYVNVHNLKTSYGKGTYVELEGLISDYNKYNDTDLDINIKHLRTTQDDLQSLIRIGSANYESVEQLRALGNIDLTLKARGRLSRFNYDGKITMEQGKLSLSGVGMADKKFENFSFEGPVHTQNVRVARIIGSDMPLDDATLSVVAKVVSRKGRPIDVSGRGNIASVVYNGYRFSNISFNGGYSGSGIRGFVAMNDGVNKLDLNANMVLGKAMKVDVVGNIDKLYLKPILMRKNWEEPYLSAHIDAHFTGSDVDNLMGTLVLDNTRLSDNNFIYNPGAIHLQALPDSEGQKRIELQSSFMTATLMGDYRFTTIGDEFSRMLHQHLPSLIAAPSKKGNKPAHNQFTFDILLNNTEDISYAFDLPFYNVEPATLKGNVNLVNSELTVKGNIKRLMFGSNDIRESQINLLATNDAGISVNANTYLVQDEGFINARLNSTVASDSVFNLLTYNIQSEKVKSDGELKVGLAFARLMNDELQTDISIYPTSARLNQRSLQVQPSHIRMLKDNIRISDFGIRQDDRLILGIDGIASKNIDDNVRVFFNDTELAPLLSAFQISNIDGIVKGELLVQRALQEPILHTNNLEVDKIQIYKDTIGTLHINGNMDATKSGLNLDSYLVKEGKKHFSIKGFVPTSGESDALDVDVDLTEIPLKWIQPFAESTFTRLSGTINSKLKVTGRTSLPITQGWLGVSDGVMQVAFTNVTYSITDTIQINPDNVGLNDLVIKDDNGHTATLSLALNHNNFGKMSYRMRMRLNDFLLLNNPARTDEQVHGNLKLSGTIAVNGTSDGIFGNVNLYNESNSKVAIELPQTASANEYQGIIYVNTPQAMDSLAFLQKKTKEPEKLNTRTSTGIPINIRGNVSLDPRIEFGVLINPTTGDAVNIKGNGKLNLSFDSKADPSFLIYGDYIAKEGSVDYNLLSLRSVNFDLREGSTLTFTGNPLNTRVDITAFNRVKADLVTLSEAFRESSGNSNRVPVDAILNLKGDLEKLDLSYDIELPEASNDVKQRVNSLINTDEVRILQFGYLVAAGNFAPSSGTSESIFSDNALTSYALGSLTKGLDALFASVLSNNWTVNTNVESENSSFDNLRMGVDVTGAFFENRLRLSTNLSYGQNNDNFANQQAFMGEFDLEYDLTPSLMLRVYNQANEKYYKRSPYTQGAGVVVKKDARRFRDLFRFRFGRKSETEPIKTDSLDVDEPSK